MMTVLVITIIACQKEKQTYVSIGWPHIPSNGTVEDCGDNCPPVCTGNSSNVLNNPQ